jgi:opacity protein-like surface antigen
MKKILLTTAAVLTLATSSAYAAEDMFYVKGQVGWDKLDKIKGFKSNNDAFFGLGVGYYVMDNVRADLTFDHYVNPTHKGNVEVEEDDGLTVKTLSARVKVKSRADTLMVNGFVDLFDVSVAKVFAGAGVGVSMISDKATVDNLNGTAKIKKKNNFAYALHLGASTEFAPGVNGELTYSYRDMGKFKKDDDGTSFGSLKGHHVAAGVRFDI